MQYGYFDDAQREYVITTPRTPYPWINYLGNEDFFGLISNTAGGYAFYKDAKFRRLTRYRYNNVPVDDGGRYFYIKEGDTVWSPGWKPVKTELDAYTCRHGLSYSRITGAKNGVEAEMLFFVPLHFHGEVHKIALRNTSDRIRQLTLFSMIEWCLWNAEDDMTNFQRNFSTGEVEIEGSTLYHRTEYKERRDHYAFYTVNAPIAGFDTDRESFLGLYNGFDRPDAVMEGRSRNSVAHGWSPIASHSLTATLAPGECREWIFVLGYVENAPSEKWEAPQVINKSKARAMAMAFDTPAKVNAALDELKTHWDTLLSTYTVDSGDPNLDRMVNIWNPYQCMVTFNLSRSASFFESGIGRGMGFRDCNQDLIGFVHQVPARARQRIFDIASTQFPDGSAYHQYQPLTKRGNHAVGGNFNDDPLWLILSVTAYLKETGDFAFLDEPTPFDNDEASARPLFDHLKAAFDHVVHNTGPHGLPLIGRADWNDCLNLNCFSSNPNESFQTTENHAGGVAESVMIAGMFVLYGREFIRLCRRIGREQEAGAAQTQVDAMVEVVKRYGWDGGWYLRAYDAEGRKVGSHENEEGKIFIESQGFCAMAGIGQEAGMVEKALDAVGQWLDTPYGIVLQQPAFSRYYIEYGEISTYPAGYKENAGIFCHNNPWIMIAETVLGRGDRAFAYYRKIAPAYIEAESALRKVEPYVYCQMVAGKDAARPGEGKNSWLTGTAAWNYDAVTRNILGVQPDYDGLRINPCIPHTWKGYRVQRHFRGRQFDITVENPDGVCHGVRQLEVDGVLREGTTVPLEGTGPVIKVRVVLGA